MDEINTSKLCSLSQQPALDAVQVQQLESGIMDYNSRVW